MNHTIPRLPDTPHASRPSTHDGTDRRGWDTSSRLKATLGVAVTLCLLALPVVSTALAPAATAAPATSAVAAAKKTQPEFIRPERVIYKGYTCTPTDDPNRHIVTYRWRAIGGQYAHLGVWGKMVKKPSYTYPQDKRTVRIETSLVSEPLPSGQTYPLRAQYNQYLTRIGDEGDSTKVLTDQKTQAVEVTCWD